MTKAIREASRNRITIPVPPDLKDRLESAAAAERRSLSSYARNVLATAVEPVRKGAAQ
jgi:hypothetical protein